MMRVEVNILHIQLCVQENKIIQKQMFLKV